jgi:hypothetical protein
MGFKRGLESATIRRQLCEGRTMPQVNYTVDFEDGVWKVGLGDKRFGPYSSLDAAVAAASKAAHKAEEQGYEAILTINTPEVAAAPKVEDSHHDTARAA